MSGGGSPEETEADEATIREVERQGHNLSRPMVVDFFIDVRDRDAALRAADAATALGYGCSVEHEAGRATWTCRCSTSMVLTLDAITRSRAELELATEHAGGLFDGWGTAGNAGSEPAGEAATTSSPNDGRGPGAG